MKSPTALRLGLTLVALASSGSTAFPQAGSAQPQFRVLEGLAGTDDHESGALAIARDGSLVLGFSASPRSRAAREAVRWRTPVAAQGLGTLPTRNVWGEARALSPDGSMAVGATSEGARLRAFIWTAATGLRGLNELPGAVGSCASGVARLGHTIVGHCEFRDEVTSSSPILYREAAIWHNGVPMGLGFLAGGYTSEALDVSADGQYVVGRSDIAGNDGAHEAFLWSAAGGLQSLGDLPGGLRRSVGVAVSDDGTVVAGWGIGSTNPYRSRMWRWTPQGGLVPLGVLPGDFNSAPADMSSDGQVIVGWSGAGGGIARRPVIWDPVHGLRDLMALLEASGVDLSAWRDAQGFAFMEATGVSDDGRTIVGRGRCAGFHRGWIATLP